MSLFAPNGGYIAPDPKDIALHQQLFKYAEDMQSLIDDHVSLESKHRMLQEAFDRTSSTFRALNRLLNHAPDLYMVTDRGGVIQHCNPACQVLCAIEGLIGSNLLDYTHSVSRDILKEMIEQALRDDPQKQNDATALGKEIYLNALSGQRIIISVSAVQSYEEDRREHIHWLLRNITRQREREFENQLASMVYSNATEGIMVTDIEGLILAVNPAYCSITGYTAEEAIGKNPKFMSSGVHDAGFYDRMWDNINQKGTWQTEIYNRNKSGDILPLRVTVNAVKNAAGETLSYIAIYTDISRLHEAERRLAFLAYHDTLTQLPNRALFRDRLEQTVSQARRGGYGASVIFIDLDRFKPINDVLGHDAGDAVLKEVARRLQNNIRDVDTAARIGGDEFVILAPGLATKDHLLAFGRKIVDQLAAPILYADRKLSVGCSIGCATFPNDGETSDTLIQHADMAMYRAKESGGATVVLYQEVEQAVEAASISVETELRKALTRGQLRVVYQPQHHADGTVETVGVEALLRWQHPILGELTPEIFIPVAERTGTIIQIGAWVLRTACKQLALWQTQGIQNLRLAVNVSARQVRDPDFIDVVREAICDTGICAALLELEIAEPVVLSDIDTGFSHLIALRDLGIRIVIDDFGTGYSSLSRLQKLPVDRLKIDPSFVKNLGHDAQSTLIANCIIEMGHAMNLDVVAEGVEIDEQLNQLREIGCGFVQGFALAKPMESEEILPYLLERNALSPSALSPTSMQGIRSAEHDDSGEVS